MSFFKKIKSVASESIQKGSDAIKNNLNIQEPIMDKITAIDYSDSLYYLTKHSEIVPKSSALKASLIILEDESNLYKLSDADNKTEIFFKNIYNSIDAKQALIELEPIVNILPFGSILFYILKFIVNNK
ncbi:hypothetical protein [Myroides sp. DW712]|uniref:hypothetical protein n=1 Tax=Myroides sp. DW712 TaxID=3389800 RepID=UPI00397E769A